MKCPNCGEETDGEPRLKSVTSSVECNGEALFLTFNFSHGKSCSIGMSKDSSREQVAQCLETVINVFRHNPQISK